MSIWSLLAELFTIRTPLTTLGIITEQLCIIEYYYNYRIAKLSSHFFNIHMLYTTNPIRPVTSAFLDASVQNWIVKEKNWNYLINNSIDYYERLSSLKKEKEEYKAYITSPPFVLGTALGIAAITLCGVPPLFQF